MTTDPITVIADELGESPVYVAPAAEATLSAADADEVAARIDDSGLPIYVVVYPLDYDDQFNGDARQLLALVHDTTGTDGVYVHASPERLTTYSVGTDDRWQEASAASEEPTAAEDLDRFLTILETGEDPAAGEASEGQSGSSGSSMTDGGIDGAVIGAIVLAVAIVVVALAAFARGRRTDPVRRAYDVPESVVEAVRTARESTVLDEAQRRVLALGEALDRTDVPRQSSAATEYQAALDAYDAASRTLDGRDGFADTVGALVLAETGEAHLARATGTVRDRRRPMPRPCYFNPMHGAATTEAELPSGSRDSVPACADCSRAIRQGKQPQALMITVNGKPVPYYETDQQPWAVTGYGALARNLIERVLTRRITR